MYKKYFFIFAMILIIVSSCVPVRVGGIVQGVVYGDLNNDGIIDDSEQMSRVANVEVTLTDCGPAHTQFTDADGKFRFENLPEGSCHVAVAKAGWIYNGSFPDLGIYPIPVSSNPDLPTAFSIYMAPTTPVLPGDSTPEPTPVFTWTPSSTPTSVTPMVTPDGVDVNCRYGPDLSYLSTGSLRIGETVPILGILADHSWLQIEDPRNLGSYCWVKTDLTITSGDLSLVPILSAPGGLVINLEITTPSIVHGYCGGPNPTSFTVSITTNGPALVTYHLEIYNGDGTFRNSTDDSTINFSAYGTQSFDPGGVYKTDCGDFYVQVFVTTPNSMNARADWSVVYP